MVEDAKIETYTFEATFIDLDGELWRWTQGMYYSKETAEANR